MKRQDKNAATVYLSQWPKTSDTYKTLRSALNRIAQLLAGRGFHGAADFDWGSIRYQEARSVAALLADEGLKPPTINKCLSALRGVLETAWRLGQIDDEEFRRINIKNVAGKTLATGRALDETEINAVLAALDKETPRNAAVITCLAGCGLRRVELVRLRCEDYDGSELRAYGKGNKMRTIPVPPRWRPYIDSWWSQLAPDANAFDDISRSTVSYIIKTFVERTGIKKFTPHDLRRTFITRVNERADPLVAQRLAGHANLNTTAIYDRRGKAAEKKAVEDL